MCKDMNIIHFIHKCQAQDAGSEYIKYFEIIFVKYGKTNTRTKPQKVFLAQYAN